MPTAHRSAHSTPRVPSCLNTLAIVAAGAYFLACRAPALAQPILLNFEDIPGMTNAPNSAIPAASRLADQYLAAHGVRFSSGSPFVAVVVHGASTPSGTRIIGGSTPVGALTYQSTFPLVATFFDPTGTTPMVVSVVSVRGDLAPVAGTKTLQAFDVDGQLIASDTQQDSSTPPLMVSTSTPRIHSVRMFSSSATVGFDDFRFDAPQAPSCPADLDNDGDFANGGTRDSAVTIEDLLYFLVGFEAGDVAVDLDDGSSTGAHDGAVTIDDLLYFLTHFEAGC